MELVVIDGPVDLGGAHKEKEPGIERKSNDRPTRTPNVVFVVVALSKPSNYSFALISMSFRDLPLL